MPAPNAISFDKLARIIGTPRAPLLIDVRSEEDFAADPRLLPGATRIDDQALAALAPQLAGQPSIARKYRGSLQIYGMSRAWHVAVVADPYNLAVENNKCICWALIVGRLVNSPVDQPSRCRFIVRQRTLSLGSRKIHHSPLQRGKKTL